jgi:RNA polymerase sigma-70 factor (ECF subfamily)
MTASTRVDEFEELRPHLLAVAYRLTGTVADAEDVVQDAWLRWDGTSESIIDLRAWLTTVVSRLSLDFARRPTSRNLHRRITPGPVVTGFNNEPLQPQ